MKKVDNNFLFNYIPTVRKELPKPTAVFGKLKIYPPSTVSLEGDKDVYRFYHKSFKRQAES